MEKDLELFRAVERKLQQNQSVVLMVVVASSGSSPGRPGFKMMVADDGEIVGSIGGGVMEIELVQSSKFGGSGSKIVERVHRKNVPNSSGMICSGTQTIIVKELISANLATVSKIVESITNQIQLVIELSQNSFEVLAIEDFRESFYFAKARKNSFLYREKLGFANQLFIIGGGHCALAFSELMSKLDFHITVIDDRPDLNTLVKNRFAHSVQIIDSYENIGEFVHSGGDSYVVAMTLGYKLDEIVIRQLCDKEFKYFGVLGSKAKMKTLLKALEKQGLDSVRLAAIRTPIGLPINSRTPEEIAISVAAEIIAVKNARN